MKFRSTVFWPEKEIGANEIVDTAAADTKATEDEMKARVAQGFAVEHKEPEPAPAEAAPAAQQ